MAGAGAACLSSGAQPARAAPQVVCLEWTAAEMAISLGLQPLAVGDTTAYAEWAVAPALPSGVADLGSRTEPNLEMLAALRPGLAIGATGYGYESLPIERFAPLHTLSMLVTPGGSAFDNGVGELRKLAERLSLKDRGEAVAATALASIAAARGSLAGRSREPLLVASIFEDRHVRIYGAGGLFDDVLRRLGLVNAWEKPAGRWGFVYADLEQLFAVDPRARLVILDPIPPHIRIRLDRSRLWNELPFVRDGRWTMIGAVWPFGGPAAAARFASELADRLPGA